MPCRGEEKSISLNCMHIDEQSKILPTLTNLIVKKVFRCKCVKVLPKVHASDCIEIQEAKYRRAKWSEENGRFRIHNLCTSKILEQGSSSLFLIMTHNVFLSKSKNLRHWHIIYFPIFAHFVKYLSL